MKLSMRFVLRLLCVVGLSALCGCSVTQRWMINPDGSGKVTFSARLPAFSELSRLNDGDGQPPAFFEGQSVAVLKMFILHVDGIEAWKDATYTETDHQTFLSLTGYFPDQSKVDADFSVGGGAGSSPGLFVSQQKDEQGNWIVTLREPRPPEQNPPEGGKPVPSGITDEDRRQAQQIQAVFREYIPKVALVVPWISSDWGIHSQLEIAGTILKAEGLQTDGHSLAWKNETLAEDWQDFEKLGVDSEFYLEFVHAVRVSGIGPANMNAIQDNPELYAEARKIFARLHISTPGTERLTIKAGPPLFDYAKEVASARAKPGRLLDAAYGTRSLSESLPPGTTRLGALLTLRDGDHAPTIKSLDSDSPAEKAGLHAGDFIESINGIKMGTVAQVIGQIRAMKPGDKVILSVRRDSKPLKVEATLEAAETP